MSRNYFQKYNFTLNVFNQNLVSDFKMLSEWICRDTYFVYGIEFYWICKCR